jgi:hypothetical protein
MTEAHQRGNMILSGGRAGKYQDKVKRIATIFGKRIRSALELLKRAPTTFLNKVGKEIRWLWRTSINRR